MSSNVSEGHISQNMNSYAVTLNKTCRYIFPFYLLAAKNLRLPAMPDHFSASREDSHFFSGFCGIYFIILQCELYHLQQSLMTSAIPSNL